MRIPSGYDNVWPDMSDGHFRSLQPRNGRCLLQKSASKKVLILKKKSSKNPPSYGRSSLNIYFTKAVWIHYQLTELTMNLLTASRINNVSTIQKRIR